MWMAKTGIALQELAFSNRTSQKKELRECATRGLEVVFAAAAKYCAVGLLNAFSLVPLIRSLVSFVRSHETYSKTAVGNALLLMTRAAAAPEGCRKLLELEGVEALLAMLKPGAGVAPELVARAAAAVLGLAAGPVSPSKKTLAAALGLPAWPDGQSNEPFAAVLSLAAWPAGRSKEMVAEALAAVFRHPDAPVARGPALEKLLEIMRYEPRPDAGLRRLKAPEEAAAAEQAGAAAAGGQRALHSAASQRSRKGKCRQRLGAVAGRGR